MTNPYKVLGVSPSADDEEIKRAYHELARKYHPDRYTNTDLADLASEKMKEVNAAYEQIQAERAAAKKGGRRRGAQSAEQGEGAYRREKTAGAGYGYQGASYQGSQYSAYAREKFSAARHAINARKFDEAEMYLDEVGEEDQGAEWHFLMGNVYLGRGFHVDAQREFDTAYRMEPTNNEYWTFKERLRRQAGSFGGGYQTSRSSGCCDGDFCTSLICADCCCECMGGDLIPCC